MYNFPEHCAERHPSWRQFIPPDFAARIQISQAEELALGIPAEKTREWPDLSHQRPHSTRHPSHSSFQPNPREPKGEAMSYNNLPGNRRRRRIRIRKAMDPVREHGFILTHNLVILHVYIHYISSLYLILLANIV
jgi:hypothetical protein